MLGYEWVNLHPSGIKGPSPEAVSGWGFEHGGLPRVLGGAFRAVWSLFPSAAGKSAKARLALGKGNGHAATAGGQTRRVREMFPGWNVSSWGSQPWSLTAWRIISARRPQSPNGPPLAQAANDGAQRPAGPRPQPTRMQKVLPAPPTTNTPVRVGGGWPVN